MKKTLRSVLLFSMLAFLAGCGSIAGALTQGKRPVFLIEAPKDLAVKFDGKNQDITLEQFATGGFNNLTIDYYTAAVKLPYKKAAIIQLNTSGKSGSVDLKPKNQSAIFWGNLIFAPIVGHIIDAVTKNNKTLNPRYIDVPAVLSGKSQSDWRSQGKLKRLSKKHARNS